MISKQRLPVIAAALCCVFLACPYPGYDYPEGHFPDAPVNLRQVNSAYDDYNISAPTHHDEIMLHFSSNRNSSGGNFDIVVKEIRYEWNKSNGSFRMDTMAGPLPAFIDSALARINSPLDELGPYVLQHYPNAYMSYQIIFSRGTGDDLDLFFLDHCPADSAAGDRDSLKEVKALNTAAGEAYLALSGGGDSSSGIHPDSVEEIYYCSNQRGDYDIYGIDLPPGISIFEYLQRDTSGLGTRVDVVCSGSDDKCPYVHGNVLVFASNRPGGYGGYDLYYSIRTKAGWSDPVNFGDRINTASDEFRPVIVSYWDPYAFDNDLMFFSSNRPGGVGGFDLYYVGVDTGKR